MGVLIAFLVAELAVHIHAHYQDFVPRETAYFGGVRIPPQ